jgi:hypothetical protein
MYDVWVAPLLGANVTGPPVGPQVAPQVVGLLDLDYDAAQHRVRAVSFAGPFQVGEPAYGHPFPQQTQQTAAAAFSKATTAQLMVSAQPELVYFPADLDAIAGIHAKVHWTAGGQFPDLAVWRMRSADGQDYIVGLDNQVYPADALPFAKGAA